MRKEKPGQRDDDALLISIQGIHAERIFKGVKLFELRRSLPRQSFGRVYMWETGGVGVIGCFDAGDPLRLPIQELWTAVGTQATPRERFFSYFKEATVGCAIPISNPVRFRKPIQRREIESIAGPFKVPVSYRMLDSGSKATALMEARRCEALVRPKVTLRRIRIDERATYAALVTAEIGPKYDEITPAFAEGILRTHKLGYDPYGILTISKSVLAVLDEKKAVIGFTTLTLKRGGSVKTGPTILIQGARGKGYGTAIRKAIVAQARRIGARKLYCTCPDDDIRTIRYLLRAGYRVEAHLEKHYTDRNGELVFGSELIPQTNAKHTSPARQSILGEAVDLKEIRRKDIVEFFRTRFSEMWLEISGKEAGSMLAGFNRNRAQNAYEEKPCTLVAVGKGTSLAGTTLIVPKRGGAAKCMLLTISGHPAILTALVNEAEREARAQRRRKLYYIHPISDECVLSVLQNCGYRPEGVIVSPYRSGVHAVIVSKLLDPNVVTITTSMESTAAPH